MNELYFYNTNSNDISMLLSEKRNMQTVAGDGKTTYVGLDNVIFKLANGKADELLTDIPLKYIVVSNEKCFFATDSLVGVCYEPYKCIPLIKKGAKKLLCSNDMLYIVFNNGMLGSVDNIHSFDNFCTKMDSLLIQKYNLQTKHKSL